MTESGPPRDPWRAEQPDPTSPPATPVPPPAPESPATSTPPPAASAPPPVRPTPPVVSAPPPMPPPADTTANTAELPRRQPQSHRGSLRSPFVQRVLPPASALAVIVIVIVLLIVINGKSPGKGPGAGVITGPPVSQVVPTPSVSPTTVPSAHPPVAVGSSRQATTPRASTSPSAARRHHVVVPLTAQAPVVVLNNSRITGLAARVAAQLRAGHWQVASVGNLQQLTPATTVYFAPGHRAAAVHLAHDFGQIQRVLPNSAGGFHSRQLTLVVTRYWT